MQLERGGEVGAGYKDLIDFGVFHHECCLSCDSG